MPLKLPTNQIHQFVTTKKLLEQLSHNKGRGTRGRGEAGKQGRQRGRNKGEKKRRKSNRRKSITFLPLWRRIKKAYFRNNGILSFTHFTSLLFQHFLYYIWTIWILLNRFWMISLQTALPSPSFCPHTQPLTHTDTQTPLIFF